MTALVGWIVFVALVSVPLAVVLRRHSRQIDEWHRQAEVSARRRRIAELEKELGIRDLLADPEADK